MRSPPDPASRLEPAAQAALLVLTGCLAIVAVEYTFSVSHALRNVIEDGIYNNIVLASGIACIGARRRRRAAIAWPGSRWARRCWPGASGTRSGRSPSPACADPPYPSIADIGFLAFYPPAYVALVLLLRSRVRELRSSLWFDGVISGLAVGAAGTAVIFPAILDTLGGASRAA